MKRDIEDVRKSIARRKKTKDTRGSNKSFRSPSLPFLQDEEKHGYLPFSQSEDSDSSSIQLLSGIMMKTMIAAILFFGIAIMFRMDSQLFNQPKQWVKQAMTEDFQFASINKWYRDYFGEPLAFLPSPKQDANTNQPEVQKVSNHPTPIALPVNGTVSQSFQNNGQGIMIDTNGKSEVLATNEGTVIFAGNKKETGKTVIIQDASNSKNYYYYGNLSEISVHQYQYVPKNQVVGVIQPTTEEEVTSVYYAVQKNNQYVDPIKVMQVDERP